MGCIGVFIDGFAVRSLFNSELALKQGHSLALKYGFGGDPEIVRRRVEEGLRLTHPFVTVAFWDTHAEMRVENLPHQDYGLMIYQDAPLYSACMH